MTEGDGDSGEGGRKHLAHVYVEGKFAGFVCGRALSRLALYIVLTASSSDTHRGLVGPAVALCAAGEGRGEMMLVAGRDIGIDR